jgi:hypothetical protein
MTTTRWLCHALRDANANGAASAGGAEGKSGTSAAAEHVQAVAQQQPCLRPSICQVWWCRRGPRNVFQQLVYLPVYIACGGRRRALNWRLIVPLCGPSCLTKTINSPQLGEEPRYTPSLPSSPRAPAENMPRRAGTGAGRAPADHQLMLCHDKTLKAGSEAS